MRTGRIARIIGQVALAGLLGLGVSVVGGGAALADDYTWDSAPADVPGTDGDYTWDVVGNLATPSDYTWD